MRQLADMFRNCADRRWHWQLWSGLEVHVNSACDDLGKLFRARRKTAARMCWVEAYTGIAKRTIDREASRRKIDCELVEFEFLNCARLAPLC
jgi:hypothetical protein